MNTDIQLQRKRFNAILKELGPPDEDVAREFLAAREVEEPEDQETAALIAQVKAKIKEASAVNM